MLVNVGREGASFVHYFKMDVSDKKGQIKSKLILRHHCRKIKIVKVTSP